MLAARSRFGLGESDRRPGAVGTWILPSLFAVALIALVACDIISPAPKGNDVRGGRAELVWRNADAPNGWVATVDGRAVYTLSLDHIVTAIDKATGATLWQKQLATSVPSRNGRGLSLFGNWLIVGDIDLLALDSRSGSVAWTYRHSVGAWPGFDKQALDNGVVYCGSATGHVYAVDPNTGGELWVSALSSDTATNVYQPKVSGGVVFVGFTHFNPAALEIRGGVAALDEQTGKLLWEQMLPHGDSLDKTGVFSGVFLTPSQVVVQASDDIMYGFDRQTGRLTTTIPITTFESSASGNPGLPEDLPSFASTNGLLFAASPTLRSVTALSASDLHHLWTIAFPWGSPTSVVADEDRLYAGAAGGQFGAFDLNGALLWSVQRFDLRSDGQEDLSFGPAIDSTQLYLTGKHEVYAFKKH